MRANERVKVAHHLGGLAERQPRFNVRLDRRSPLVAEALGPGHDKRVVGEVGERVAAPDPPGALALGMRTAVITDRPSRSGGLDRPAVAVEVEISELQSVSARPARDQPPRGPSPVVWAGSSACRSRCT